MIKNPNEYDDDTYQRGQINLMNAISDLWGAGASADNIERELENAFENEDVRVNVLITEKK